MNAGKCNVGAALDAIKRYHNLTADAMAKKCGLSKSHFSMLTSGKRQPSLDTLYDIASAFDIKVGTVVLLAEFAATNINPEAHIRAYIHLKSIDFKYFNGVR